MKALAALGLVSCLALAGCTVQPLYGGLTSSVSAFSEAAPELALVYISQPSNRVDQQVRNQLAFMLYGGTAQPADPRYHLDFSVRTRTHRGAAVPPNPEIEDRSDIPTTTVLTMTAVYSVINTHTGEQITVGQAQAMASFDLTRQEFSNLRAQRDAEDRAAREIAAQIGLNVAARMLHGDS